MDYMAGFYIVQNFAGATLVAALNLFQVIFPRFFYASCRIPLR